MAAKLALIDAELLIRLLDRQTNRPPDQPILREMNAIDSQMQDTLSDSRLSDLAKSQKINSLLSKHENFKKQFENLPPPTVNLAEAPVHTARDQWYDKIIASVPQTLKHKAQNLLDHIKDSEAIAWTPQGHLILDGVTLSNTNVLDLVHSVTRKRVSQPTPEGAGRFLEALEKINTPKELLPNADTILKDTIKINAKKKREQETQAVTTTPVRAKKRKRNKSRQSPGVDFDRWQTVH